ncbi:glycosyltransferase family 4 protein [Sphaerotilus natans]|uniref:glycosyltransferase family 4 protein n=1 Tax=Sphaerotilus natans TaxID=34103 RepID=UPI00406CF722
MKLTSSSKKSTARIGVDFHTWDGIFQGSRSHILGIYRAAIRQAPEIEFIFFLNDTESLRRSYYEFSLPNVQLVRMTHRSPLFRLAAQLPWMQWRWKLDLLHTQYRLPLLRFGACACTVHDVLFETHPEYFSPSFVWQSRITYRIAVARAAVLFAVSQFSKSELTRIYDVQPERIAVTYNGVDGKRFFSGTADTSLVTQLGLVPSNYILTVGRLEPRKNHTALIEAYSKLGENSPKLVIVGQRDFSFNTVFETIKKHKLDDKIIILEKVDDATLPAVIRHAMIFVYPAFAEGFGMPVAEAMASGVPVITSNTTSLPEVAGGSALLIDPTSVQQLHAAMQQLIEDSNLRRHLSQVGLAQVQKFDWEQSASVLLASMRNFLSKRSSND